MKNMGKIKIFTLLQTENICIFVTLILRNTKRYARLANG